MSPESQVILRNQSYFAEGKWLVVNPVDAGLVGQLGQLHAWHQFYDAYLTWPADQASFSLALNAADYAGVLVYLPKAKRHLHMLLHELADKLSGKPIFLVGHNKAGIKSAHKVLSDYADDVRKEDSAKHCSLLSASLVKPDIPFSIEKYTKVSTYSLDDKTWQVANLPGVFSEGQLDDGTRLLLANIQTKLPGKVLDFACGAGVIAAYLGSQQYASQFVLSDVSALALYCAQQTMQLNHLTATIVPSDGLQQIDGQFTHIITNPPFHTGIQTNYSIVADFIQQCKNHLIPNGKLYLVANQFLPYEQSLAAHFKQSELLQETKGYKIYRCV